MSACWKSQCIILAIHNNRENPFEYLSVCLPNKREYNNVTKFGFCI